MKSHILPKALTRPIPNGEYFISGGPGQPPKKRWSSWYDEELVIRKGEDILENYDTWGIRELRRLELVWSGWSSKTTLPAETWFGPKPEGFGLRTIECTDPGKLRRFFLSILWRAASTSLSEFREINFEIDELDHLRKIVVGETSDDLDFYPMTLLQLISRGPTHNLGPFPRNYGGTYFGIDVEFRTFRFYFDGLILIVVRKCSLDLAKFEQFLVGPSSTFQLQTRMFENSFQLTNMLQHHAEVAALWPDRMERLLGLPPGSIHRGNTPR